MAFSDADIYAGADQIARLMDDGHPIDAANRLRSEAFEMNQDNFHKLIKEVQSAEKTGTGADVELVENGSGRTTVCMSGVELAVDPYIASVQKGKVVDSCRDKVPDPLSGCFVELSDIPKLPQLNDCQKRVLLAFDDAVRVHDPQRVEDLLVSFRGRAKDLNPIMECLAADLSKSGIGLRYTTGNMGVGAAGDLQETGYLDLWDKNGGPVVDFVGHPKFKPQIDFDAVKGKDGSLNFYQRERAAYLDDRDTIMREVSGTMRSFAAKMPD
jgi:hypothetical protein